MKVNKFLPQKNEVEVGEEVSLEQKYKKLEQEWSFIKKSDPRNSQSSTDSNVIDETVPLTEIFPVKLMSSLQQQQSTRLSSEGYICKWRQNDRAAVEILEDRWDAIESGRLKGKRLFEDLSSGESRGGDICSECESGVSDGGDICSECDSGESEGGDICSECESGLGSSCGSDGDGDGDENENLSWNCEERLCFDFCYSSSVSEESVVVGTEMKKTEKVEVKSEIGGFVSGYRKIWVGVIIAWLGVIFTLSIVSRRKFNCGYVEEAMMLVPT